MTTVLPAINAGATLDTATPVGLSCMKSLGQVHAMYCTQPLASMQSRHSAQLAAAG